MSPLSPTYAQAKVEKLPKISHSLYSQILWSVAYLYIIRNGPCCEKALIKNNFPQCEKTYKTDLIMLVVGGSLAINFKKVIIIFRLAIRLQLMKIFVSYQHCLGFSINFSKNFNNEDLGVY